MENLEEAKQLLEQERKDRVNRAVAEITEVCKNHNVTLFGIPSYDFKDGEWKLVINIQVTPIK